MAKEQKQKTDDTPDCCRGCLRWKQFGRNCWVYWDLKKHCTMYVAENEAYYPPQAEQMF